MKKIISLIVVFAIFLMPVPIVHSAGTVGQLRGVWVQDIGGMPLMGLNRPTYIDAVVLTADTASTFTIPERGGRVSLSSSSRFPASSAASNFWIDFNFTPGYVVTPSLIGDGGTISGRRVGLSGGQPQVTVPLKDGWRVAGVGGTCGGSGSLSGKIYTYTVNPLSADCTVEITTAPLAAAFIK